MTTTTEKQQEYRTVLFWQKETQGSHVYGNAVIRAMYIPKTVIDPMCDDAGQPPSTITMILVKRPEVTIG